MTECVLAYKADVPAQSTEGRNKTIDVEDIVKMVFDHDKVISWLIDSLSGGTCKLFYLERQFADNMIAHARAEIPNECCGILAGAKGRVTRLYRAINAKKSPFRYSIDPNEQLHIYKEIEKNCWDVLGIYHSHTHTEAYPSAVDINITFWPDSSYFIVSFMDINKPVIRAFKIVDGQVSEELMEIT